jgi:Zn-dependent protease
LRHVDPVGTVLVPGLLIALGGPLIGWARPVPVATEALPNPRRAMVLVALAGPAANVVMALFWCTVLGLIARVSGNPTLINWIALMAVAGISINVVLAIFNLLPIPPLAGGRILAGLLPPSLGAQFQRLEPVGFFVVLAVVALVSFGPFGGIFDPANRLVGHLIGALLGQSA